MRVALTWDDGPSEWTEPILDLLAEHGAKATFFVCGHALIEYQYVIERMADDGHEVGVHTWSHPHLTDLDDDEVRKELRDTIFVLCALRGNPTLWRAPYFSIDQRVRKIALEQGLTHVGCTINPGDWCDRSAHSIASNVNEHAADGSIVDLHDGIPPDGGTGTRTRQPTVDATALILAANPHVQFVTVSELVTA